MIDWKETNNSLLKIIELLKYQEKIELRKKSI